MIGGNLAFGIGWWGANQSGSSLGKSCGKFLRENLAGNTCGEILWENLVGKGGREKANLRKAVIGGNLAFGIGWSGANQSGFSLGKSCGKILREILAGKSCGKMLWEILAGKGGGEKANLRKAVIGGNLAFGIGWWGANQSGSSLGKSCGKFLQENLAGKSCGKILAGKSCGKILREILAGKGGREKANLRKAVIGGNLAFRIGWWGANQSGSSLGKSCGKILGEILAGKSCGKMLWEILAGKGGGEKAN